MIYSGSSKEVRENLNATHLSLLRCVCGVSVEGCPFTNLGFYVAECVGIMILVSSLAFTLVDK